MKFLKIVILIFLVNFINFNAFSEQSAEDIIKKRKSLFSENYKTALFPENTKEGFGTQSLPSIWENKDEFNALMQKSSDDMIKLASLIEESEDIRGTLKQYMWNNCNACHSKFRKPH